MPPGSIVNLSNSTVICQALDFYRVKEKEGDDGYSWTSTAISIVAIWSTVAVALALV